MLQAGLTRSRMFLVLLALAGTTFLNLPANSQSLATGKGQLKTARPDAAGPEIGLPPPLDGKEKPILVTDAAGHSANVRAAFFHPNGENVVTVSMDKTVRLWDLASGESLMTFRLPTGPGDDGSLSAGDIAPDGRWLAVGGLSFGRGRFGYPIHVVSIEKGQVEFSLKGHKSMVVGLAFSHDGRTLASASNDDTAMLFDLKDRRLKHVLRGHTKHLRKVAFSHDDKYLATSAQDGSIRIWSVANGQQVTVLEDFPADPICVAWHPKEHTLATGCADGFFQLWDVDGKQKKKFQLASKAYCVTLAFSPDGQELLFGGFGLGDRCGIFNLKEEKVRLIFKEHSNTIFQGRYSADGKMAITTGGNDHETYVWNTEDGSVLQKLQGAGKSVWTVGWRLDSKAIAWGNTNFNRPLEQTFDLESMSIGGKPDHENFGRTVSRSGPWALRRLDERRIAIVKDGKELHVFQSNIHQERIHSWSILPGNRAVFAADFTLFLVDLSTNKIARIFHGHAASINAVSPCADRSKYFLTGSSDQTISLWDPDRDDPLVSLFVAGREWIAWTPQGYYACSPYGERLMGWQINHGWDRLGSFHPAARFRNSLYQPNLVRLIFQEKSLEKALVAASQDLPDPIRPVNVSQVLPPQVGLILPSGPLKESTIVAKAIARSSGEHPITAMRLLVDGRPFKGDKGIVKFDPPRKGEVEASWKLELLPGKHQLAAVAESTVSKGVSSWREITRVGVKAEQLPDLVLLSVGISAYPGPLALNYAHKDAIVLEKTLKANHQGVFRRVRSKLLIDRDATRQNIIDGLAWLEKTATPKDVVVLFLGGHGSRDPKGQFHFIPVDVKGEDLEGTAVAGNLLKKKLANLPGRVVVLLDACHSGAAKKKQPLIDDLARDLVSEDAGIVVMCSSRGSEYSLESKKVEHGFFTLGLVEALSGRADFNKDTYIYLHELDFYTFHRVRQLSEAEQNPTTGRPAHLRSFPLAKVK